MTERTSLVLAVASGSRLGASAELRADHVLTVGRSTRCHLVISDPNISRRHVDVTFERGVVRAQTSTGTAPFRFRGALESDAVLVTGDEIVLGDTRLRVVEANAQSMVAAAHDAVTLLGGRLTDLEGIAAVFALSEALESCDSVESFTTTVALWARRFIPAAHTAFRFLEEGDAEGDGSRAMHVTTRGVPTGTVLTVVAIQPGHGTCAIDLTIPFEAGAVTDALRRLLVISARLCSLALARVRAVVKVERENVAPRHLAVGNVHAFLGTSDSAKRIAYLVPRLAASDASVLVLGETGTGKSFVARLIHEASRRAKEPFRVLNCAAIPDTLIEAELFGHEKGAFTGAVASRAGAFESASCGTLFLDEIGELPLASQAKLLRAIEERRFERVGSNRTLTMHARVIAATNRDLETLSQQGKFRRDLLYRLSVVAITVSTLPTFVTM